MHLIYNLYVYTWFSMWWSMLDFMVLNFTSRHYYFSIRLFRTWLISLSFVGCFIFRRFAKSWCGFIVAAYTRTSSFFFYTWHFFFSLQLPAEIYLKTSFYFDVLFWIIFSSDFVADLPFLESKPILITHTILKDTWNFSVFVID